MFLSRNKKNNVYPCKSQFYHIKVGFQGSKLDRRVFVKNVQTTGTSSGHVENACKVSRKDLLKPEGNATHTGYVLSEGDGGGLESSGAEAWNYVTTEMRIPGPIVFSKKTGNKNGY